MMQELMLCRAMCPRYSMRLVRHTAISLFSRKIDDVGNMLFLVNLASEDGLQTPLIQSKSCKASAMSMQHSGSLVQLVCARSCSGGLGINTEVLHSQLDVPIYCLWH